MTTRAFPFAALVLAHEAPEPAGREIAELARTATDVGAMPVIVAVPFAVDLPGNARIVRTRAGGSAIAAIRLGMAQLTNTVARAALLVPYGAAETSLVSLLALLDASKRSGDALVAFEGAALDSAAVLVPRDAWLELVTLGENGMRGVAARRSVVRVPPPPD